MTYRISKEFSFSASHQLDGLDEGHPCGRVHGHNYVVRVDLVGDQLDEVGMLVDYGDLAPLRAYLDDVLDHRHLNDVMPGNPTAENLAAELWHVAVDALALPEGVAVEVAVSETPKTWASYRP